MQSKWIWYRGDYEIYHGLKLHSRRREYDVNIPPFWCQPTVYPTVSFAKVFEAKAEGYVKIVACGDGFVRFDGDKKYPMNKDIFFSEGTHRIDVTVNNPGGLPCIYAVSDTVATDRTWIVSDNTSTAINAGDNPAYTDVSVTPENFPFSYRRIFPVSTKPVGDGMLYDFGSETFAELMIENSVDNAGLSVYFGESEEEATDTSETYLYEKIGGMMSYRLSARAFRFVYIPEKLAASLKLSAYYEYLPLEDIGSFECDDELINDVWKTCAYTFHLCSREFFLDGIKRDRWVWSGDAYQSYMINNYLFHDNDITRRTITLLLGKSPYKQHINSINDYSMYLICGVYDYYFSSGDSDFVKFIMPRVKELYDFAVSRLDERGYVVQRPGDWIFIDWADIDKAGASAGEQMLLYKAMCAMNKLCAVCGEDGSKYESDAAALKEKIDRDFWREERGAYVDSADSGLEKVGRHTNVLALMTGVADNEKKKIIIEKVLKNEDIPHITTPYFGFYELDALCECGELEYAVEQIRSYWGGMLKLGATSIWEQYLPHEKGAEHYAMYGMKYGRSLCHAWGAGPVYLLGRYFLGVKATSVGAKTFEVRPQTGGLEKIMGTVPLNDGYVYVEYEKGRLKVYTDKSGGTLILGNKKLALKKDENLIVDIKEG